MPLGRGAPFLKAARVYVVLEAFPTVWISLRLHFSFEFRRTTSNTLQTARTTFISSESILRLFTANWINGLHAARIRIGEDFMIWYHWGL